MSVSDQLLDLLTVRQLLLERIIAGQNVEMNKQLDAIAEEIIKALKGKELTEYQGKRLDKAVSELVSMVKINAPDLAGIAASEASFVNNMFASVGIDTVIPSASIVTEIAKSAVMQGGTMGEWFGQLNETTRFNLSRTIKNGVSLGLTNAQIAKSLMGKGDKGSEPIAKARRDAMAITRTATQTVANDVRMASYMENADIIKAVQWVSTLDSRTSDICIARAGKTWTFPEFKPIGHNIPWNNGPPAHWACRSTSVPVTRSMAEITGKAADQIAPRTRASMDGQVAQDLTFDQFLKNKPPEFADEMLGKGRAKLWRSGKITLSQLLDQRGNSLTLTQLERKYGRP
jgi:SPP1 gp7 family putative phage head morphogenesis protein